MLKKVITSALMAIAMMAGAGVAQAESIVYVFLPSMNSTCKVDLTVNGVSTGEISAPVMQHYDGISAEQVAKMQKKNPKLKIPVVPPTDITFPMVKKCTLTTDGPTVIVANVNDTHIITGEPIANKVESTIDIEDGKTYYLNVVYQTDPQNPTAPPTNVQLAEISETEGQAMLNDANVKATPEYVEK
ncbi:MAG: hypothetical protein LUC85_05090 [Bacteroidales bacterium]|nr:hypothetical protein [Bacteroidales bacterium]